MIILDNSVLSAFKRLKLLSKLKKLISSAMISKEVFNEYSDQWQKEIPNWIEIKQLDDEIIHQESGYIGTATNNTAEYKAIINVLKAAEKFHRGYFQIFSNSNLTVQQINRKMENQ